MSFIAVLRVNSILHNQMDQGEYLLWIMQTACNYIATAELKGDHEVLNLFLDQIDTLDTALGRIRSQLVGDSGLILAIWSIMGELLSKLGYYLAQSS